MAVILQQNISMTLISQVVTLFPSRDRKSKSQARSYHVKVTRDRWRRVSYDYDPHFCHWTWYDTTTTTSFINTCSHWFCLHCNWEVCQLRKIVAQGPKTKFRRVDILKLFVCLFFNAIRETHQGMAICVNKNNHWDFAESASLDYYLMIMRFIHYTWSCKLEKYYCLSF